MICNQAIKQKILHHRIGDLEKQLNVPHVYLNLHHRIGDLEKHAIYAMITFSLHHRIGDLEKK